MPTLTLSSLLALSIESGPWWSYPVAILGIGFLIFVHELGHFLACRATKTRVETFSIGFGTRLFGWETFEGKRVFTVGARRHSAAAGAMDVRIALIPLGGYVKMAGEIGGDGSPGEGGERRAPRPDEFPGKPFAARLLIITAGVLMNAITAFAFFTIALLVGLREASGVVGEVVEGGPAWRAGVRVGDRLVSVDGVPVRSFQEFQNEVVYLSDGQTVPLVVDRRGKRLELPVTVAYDEGSGTPKVQVLPGGVWTVKDSEPPGLHVGPEDRVLVEGRLAVGGWEAYHAAQSAHTGGTETATVEFLERTEARAWRVRVADPERKVLKVGLVLWEPMIVDAVRPGSEAETAGVRAGDEVLSVDGRAITRQSTLGALAQIGMLEVRRAGAAQAIRVDRTGPESVAEWVDGLAFKGTGSTLRVQPESLQGGTSPVGEAGLRRGDRVLAVDGLEVSTFQDLTTRLKAGKGTAPVRLKVATGDAEPREIVVTPRLVPDWRTSLDTVGSSYEPVPVAGVVEAMAMGGTRTVKEIRNVFRVIRSLVTRDVSAEKNLGGPGTLVKMSSRSVDEGLGFFLWFLAFISVNLCVLNILPIPVLDGGHLLFLIVEKIKGKPLTEAAIARAQMVGFILLMALMVFAVTNDIRHW